LDANQSAQIAFPSGASERPEFWSFLKHGQHEEASSATKISAYRLQLIAVCRLQSLARGHFHAIEAIK